MPKPRPRARRQPELRALLTEAGLRRTPAREAVLGLLEDAGRPLAHGEIAGARGMGHLDRVTVYRTLAALQKAGLVHRVRDKNGVWRFCAHAPHGNACPGNHAHFLCTRCGRMRCLTTQPLPWVTAPRGAEVTGKQFVVYGLCSTCVA